LSCSNTPRNFELLPADTPYVDALAQMNISLNGNNPPSPNILLRPVAGSNSALEAFAVISVLLAFGYGSS
jgi:hypothetical protein